MSYFWVHLALKSWGDRVRRLKYLPCALELLQRCREDPVTKENPNRAGELLHRFAGLTRSRVLFYVHVREDRRSGTKEFMSVYPAQ